MIDIRRLKEFEGRHCKLLLSNGYCHIGLLKEVNGSTIVLNDRFDGKKLIDVSIITSISESGAGKLEPDLEKIKRDLEKLKQMRDPFDEAEIDKLLEDYQPEGPNPEDGYLFEDDATAPYDREPTYEEIYGRDDDGK